MSNLRVTLYQPGIAANYGNIMRSCACIGVPLSVVEPTGFPLATKDVRRAAMDYGARVDLARHANWGDYKAGAGRTVLFTTKGATRLDQFTFQLGDHLFFGNESAGVPDFVLADCDARVVIPIQGRSLNLSNSVAIAMFEALRQMNALAKSEL